jgi:hypothetical protein
MANIVFLNSGIGGANTYPAAVHVDWLPVPVATTSPLVHVNVHLLPATLVHVEGKTRLVVAAAGHVHVTGRTQVGRRSQTLCKSHAGDIRDNAGTPNDRRHKSMMPF